jgi:hypothetical protein
VELSGHIPLHAKLVMRTARDKDGACIVVEMQDGSPLKTVASTSVSSTFMSVSSSLMLSIGGALDIAHSCHQRRVTVKTAVRAEVSPARAAAESGVGGDCKQFHQPMHAAHKATPRTCMRAQSVRHVCVRRVFWD